MIKKEILNSCVTLILLLVSASLVSGCFEEEDSCNLRTPGIYAEFFIWEEDGQARATAAFWTGDDPGGTALELGACGDSIRINGIKMSEDGTGLYTKYVATVPATDDYVFAFDRPDEETYYSHIDGRPGPLQITAPHQAMISRDEDIPIAWKNESGTQARLTIEGSCFPTYSELVTDDGQHVVPSNKINAHPQRATETCAARISLWRNLYGTLSPDLKGSVAGIRDGNAFFDSTPAKSELPWIPGQ